MKNFVKKFDYGNCDISSGLDNFWLNGSIKISAIEQVDFLKKFFHKKLDVSEKNIEAVKSILIQEKNETYKLSYKTGTGRIGNGSKFLGWLVGYIEKADNVYFFALNLEGDDFDKLVNARIEIAMNFFRELKII